MKTFNCKHYPRKGDKFQGMTAEEIVQIAHTGYALILTENEVILVRAIEETVYVPSYEKPCYIMELPDIPETGASYTTKRYSVIGPLKDQHVTTGKIVGTVEVYPGRIWYAESANSAYYVVVSKT